VAAPGGDLDRAIFMTDRQGSSAGFNTGVYADDFADYVFNNTPWWHVVFPPRRFPASRR